jgi:hypothetical protein
MLRQRAALTVLGAVLVFTVLALTPTPAPPRLVAEGRGDVAAFQAMVSRIRAGESYYPAFGSELRERGYPARSVFNWRTPMLLNVLARIPDVAGRSALWLLGLLLLAATFRLTAHERLWVAGSNVMQAGALVPVIAVGAVLIGEVWSGVLIGLSLCMFARQRTAPAVALGVLALFLRELAAPYCAACAIAALVQRRWREVWGWFAGACLYALYYGWHVAQVWAHRLPTDTAHASPWLAMEGLTSVLRMARWHAWLLPSPPWATALALTLVVVGAFAARTPLHARLATAAYLAFFTAAGQSFNGYWGFAAWPAWALASGFGLQEVFDAVGSLAPLQNRQVGSG